MFNSTSIPARLLAVPLALALAACGDHLTQPVADSATSTSPAFAVAAVSPISTLEGTAVQFYCGSSTDAEGDPLLCQWDFGNDGTFDAQCTTVDATCRWDFNNDGAFEGSRLGSFDYTWRDQGTFAVRLDVSDTNGDHSSTTTQVSVADVAPILSGREPLILDVGQTQRMQVRFEDPGADSAWTWTFDFGDGSPVIGPRRGMPGIGFGQFHAYAETGTYVVTVTVTDKDGVTSSLERIATVINNVRPVADAGGPYTALENTAFLLSSAATTDDQYELLTYSWDFGDGTRSADPNPSKRYTDNGTYTARLVVTDPTGAADTAFTSVNVQNVAPTGSPSAPVSLREGTAYTLRMYASDPSYADRLTLQYSFDCGQGAGATEWSSTNNVLCPGLPDQGSVTSTLSVRDKDGGLTTYLRTVTASNDRPVVTLAPVGATTIAVGGTLHIQGAFTDLGAADGPFTYRITWGDGGAAGTTNGSLAGTTPSPVTGSHVFTRTGTFTVTLYVTDKDLAMGRSNSITVTVTP